MAVVSYAPGIDYAKGSLAKPKKKNGHSCGDYLIATHREKPTTNPNCTRLYVRPASTYGVNISQTANSIAARNRFAAVAALVKARRQDLTHMVQDQQDFKAQKDLPGGKKTMTSYYWYIMGQQYDQSHSNG